MNRSSTVARIVKRLAFESGRVFQYAYSVSNRIEIAVDARLERKNVSRVDVGSYFSKEWRRIRPIKVEQAEAGQRPCVCVFAFLDGGGFFGGIATLLTSAALLANALGYDLKVVQTISAAADVDVVAFLEAQGIEVDRERFSMVDVSSNDSTKRSIALREDDVIVVSAWWDAYVAQHMDRDMPFVYLIQDYEPIFYGNGDHQVLAESTYSAGGFIALINTSILAEYFVSEGYAFTRDALIFEPAVISSRGQRRGFESESRSLFLYARPWVTRNLFAVALKAIDTAFSAGDVDWRKWRVCMAGSNDVPQLQLSCGLIVEHLGKMSLEDYRMILHTVDVAVSPMLSPHPNYPTLEFARAGARVVTTSWRTKTDLSRYGGKIDVVPATVEDLALAIERACRDCSPTVDDGVNDFRLGTSWTEALQPASNELARRLQQRDRL